jgi:putative NIF3 family GTP cyclohydrolase 1 type 2
VFNPQEEKLLQECKLKFQVNIFQYKRVPKRKSQRCYCRSVAQKYIKHFSTLGVDPFIIADVMLYNIEIAQAFSAENTINRNFFIRACSTLSSNRLYDRNGILNLRD